MIQTEIVRDWNDDAVLKQWVDSTDLMILIERNSQKYKVRKM